MIQKYLRLLAFLITFSGCTQTPKLSHIEQEETTRLIKTLSADDMQGRAVFTPGIEKAADFIQDEFRRIGLKPFTSSSTDQPGSYRQTFNYYRLTTSTSQIQLNGKPIAPEKVIVLTNHEQLNWTTDSSRPVITIGAGENMRDAFTRVNKLEHDALVLIHPSHAEAFGRYQHRYGQGGMKQELNKGSSKILVLTEITAPQAYTASVAYKAEHLPLSNVAGMIEGKRKNEFVLFSAHYDHIGILAPVNGDSIANGADDNAAGTSAIIMLARYFRKGPQPERTLVFVAFTAEEVGGYGSKHFSEQLDPEKITAMFNIEMVGKPSKFGPNTAYLTGFEKSDLGPLMQKRLEKTPYRIYPDPYPEQNLFYRSDNATLARLGVPAHTISSVQIDKDDTYHTVHDEFEQLNMEHLTNMIKAIAIASGGVVSGQDTPGRVDKTLVR